MCSGGTETEKVDLDIPSSDAFVHTVYTNVARKVYTNIYLFEKHIAPLQQQKYNRELEIITKECILNSVRDSMPVETILRAYLDETDEVGVDVKEEEVLIPKELTPEQKAEEDKQNEEPTTDPQDLTPVVVKAAGDEQVSGMVPLAPIPEIPSAPMSAPPTPPSSPVAHALTGNDGPSPLPRVVVPSIETKIPVGFSDIDKAVDVRGNEVNVTAPKTIERLEQIASVAAEKRKLDDDDDDDDILTIGDEVKLEMADINDLNRGVTHLNPPVLEDIEILT